MAVPYISSYDKTVPFSDTNANMNLVANVALTYTVPGPITNKYSMRFAFTSIANIFVGYNTPALIPASGTIVSEANIEFRTQEQRYVKGGDVLSFITPDTTQYVGISLRAIPN